MSYRVFALRFGLGGVLAACVLLSGCGGAGDLARVEGRVTVGGKPVEGLLVEFQPTAEGGSPSAAITDARGHYELMYTFKKRGVMAGENIVTIRTAATFYEEECEQDDRQRAGSTTRVVTPEINVQRRATVEPGRNRIDFDL